ncbi:non-muscle caldesmon isoform X2 [Engraulis encrasicolus]|uniref:non-muscle caldesmon isoform X2 n=1 Tax=Engraulis encrasicolus TaxID=184585 RepID=UPI002FD6040E
MSGALLRRNSSKQGLENLLRVTAQRSIEDAEEIERERRRRAREAFRKESSHSGADTTALDTEAPAEATQAAQSYVSVSKGSSGGRGSVGLEEDEGFGDWTQRLAQDRRQRLENGRPAEADTDKGMNGAAKHAEKMRFSSTSTTSSVVTSNRLQRPQPKEEKENREREVGREEADGRLGGRMTDMRRKEFGRKELAQADKEIQQNGKESLSLFKKNGESPVADVDEKIKRKDIKASYTSKVLMQQESNPKNGKDNGPVEEATTDVMRTRKMLRSPSQTMPPALALESPREEEAALLETEQKLEKIRRSLQEKESQELEQMRLKQVEAEAELEELKRRREARRLVREEEERKKEEEEQERQAKEEEERRHMKEEIERRRMEAAEKRMKSLGVDGEEPFNALNPKSPTVKITERTDSLNRSLKKSNSFKKTLPPMLLSKIDDKLEQYTQAVESSSKEASRPAKAAVMDVLSPPKPVACTKSLFEDGEAWAQNSAAPRGQPSKEVEGIKVGVADLITNWVKGSPDGSSKNSPSKPSDVKPGDVLHKKNMWEIIGENSSPGKAGGKGQVSGKKYKFVVTGHGKYEKKPSSGELCQDDF